MATPGLRFTYQYDHGINCHDTTALEVRGRFAVEFAKHYGMIAGAEDGEDSQGRAKVRLLTPVEVVCRAVEVADRLFFEINNRGWLQDIPSEVVGKTGSTER